MSLIIFSILCLLVMIVFFCIYSIRSIKSQSNYGNDYYNDGIENFDMKKAEEDDYEEYKPPDDSSEFERDSDISDQKDKTFEKVL